MTKLWGPLGWMTLHSISFLYPVNPSAYDKLQAMTFLDSFVETISCHICKSHFIGMYNLYKKNHPEYLNSRQDFAMFIFRAHNTVNKRLDKPIQKTVSDCVKTLENAIANTSFAQFRISYLNYLARNWGKQASGEGFIIARNVKVLRQINDTFWTPKDLNQPIDLEEGNVLEFIENNNVRINPLTNTLSNIRVGFIGGRLQLARR
jgi:hypothetical protein